jgi:MFS family permease
MIIPPARKSGVFINKNFILLWWGQAISIVGDFVFETTLLFWIAYDLARHAAWGPLATSAIFVCTYVPMLIVRPIAGVFADRWNRRRTMVSTDIFRAIIVAVFLLFVGTIPLPAGMSIAIPLSVKLGALYAAVLLINIAGQLFNPSRLALTGEIVPEALRGRAFGLEYVTENLAVVVGPPLAALLFLTGIGWGIVINALSYLVSFATIALIHAPRETHSQGSPRRGVARELGEAARLFASSRLLVALCVSLFIATLGFGCINSLLVFFTARNLHSPPAVYSALAIAVGLGAIAGAGVASLFAQRLGMKPTYWISIAIMGIMIIVFARLTDPRAAIALGFFIGIPQAALNVAIGPFLLNASPPEMVGRISSIFNPLVVVAQLLSIGAAGYLAGVALASLHGMVFGWSIGPIDTVLTFSGILAILGALSALIWLPAIASSQDAGESDAAAETLAERGDI